MKKVLTIAALIALLAVPLFAVSATPAQSQVCPQGVNWSAHQIPPPDGNQPLVEIQGVTEYCVKSGNVPPENGNDVSFGLNGCEAYYELGSFEYVSGVVSTDGTCGLSHWSYRLVVPTEIPTRVPPPTPEPITLENSCAGWRLKQGGQTIDGAAWEDPFSLEVAASVYVDYLIREPRECLKEKGDPTLAIGGQCTEDGDSQEIGYNFSDGDFDGARLIITRSDGVEVANAGDSGGGRVFFPARAGDYTWKIVWFNGQTRETFDRGAFSVAKCDIEEPPPEDCSNTGDNICPGDEPPEHPPTGADPNTTLAVVIGLAGYALAGIGGSILFMKRRASR